VRLFPDDMAIFLTCVKLTHDGVGCECVQSDLTRLKRYFTTKKLTLKANKTSYLVFKALNKKFPDMPP
jgi:hypothetical protein